MITFHNRARYGQVLFLAGGAGSGKDYALDNFIDTSSFIVFDVDAMKAEFVKFNNIVKRYPQLLNLDTRTPEDATKIHQFVKELGLDDRITNAFFKDKNRRFLPNICFNSSMRRKEQITDLLPLLKKAGYQRRNIHLIWVLTNFKAAIKNNAQRSRVAPREVLFETHEGAFETVFFKMILGGLPFEIDGSVAVILNNRENTIFYQGPNGSTALNQSLRPVVERFSYVNLKEPGMRLNAESDVYAKFVGWVLDNVPRTAKILI